MALHCGISCRKDVTSWFSIVVCFETLFSKVSIPSLLQSILRFFHPLLFDLSYNTLHNVNRGFAFDRPWQSGPDGSNNNWAQVIDRHSLLWSSEGAPIPHVIQFLRSLLIHHSWLLFNVDAFRIRLTLARAHLDDGESRWVESSNPEDLILLQVGRIGEKYWCSCFAVGQCL